jgi:hypothetical protein
VDARLGAISNAQLTPQILYRFIFVEETKFAL